MAGVKFNLLRVETPVFFLAYLVLSAAISLPLTAAALNGGLAGVLVAAALAAPADLWLTIFTYLFVASLVDPGLRGGRIAGI